MADAAWEGEGRVYDRMRVVYWGGGVAVLKRRCERKSRFGRWSVRFALAVHVLVNRLVYDSLEPRRSAHAKKASF